MFTSAAGCHRPFSFFQLCFLSLWSVLFRLFLVFYASGSSLQVFQYVKGCFCQFSLLCLPLLPSAVSKLTHRLLKVLSVLYFSNPAEKSAWLLTKRSTISVSFFFSLVNRLTRLLQEQYPADKLVLFQLSVSPPFRCLVCQYRVGL